MADESKEGQQRGLPEGLRNAIERTFAATTGSASETRERAQDLLDEVTRRGQGARDVVARRGQEARDASASATSRLIEALQEMRLATREDLSDLRDEIAALSDRVAALERRDPGGAGTDPKVEG